MIPSWHRYLVIVLSLLRGDTPMSIPRRGPLLSRNEIPPLAAAELDGWGVGVLNS
jgi:hypothetical protein